jgi:hypothetical protein
MTLTSTEVEFVEHIAQEQIRYETIFEQQATTSIRWRTRGWQFHSVMATKATLYVRRLSIRDRITIRKRLALCVLPAFPRGAGGARSTTPLGDKAPLRRALRIVRICYTKKRWPFLFSGRSYILGRTHHVLRGHATSPVYLLPRAGQRLPRVEHSRIIPAFGVILETPLPFPSFCVFVFRHP